jgi:hypothetical protein
LAVVLTLFASLAFSHGMSDAEKAFIIDGGNLSYIWIGATHMLSGYDHLAFVFGIVFFLTRFKEVVKYITAFTVGHSITLIFATFNGLQVNYFLIDAVIALSVCYIAFQNLDGFKQYLQVKAPNMLGMIFSLGLIHGLGLSTRLQQLPLNTDQLLMNIISFNVGIEIGQIAALALMLLLISTFRNNSYFPIFSKISNYFLLLAGGFLFMVQMHSYAHSTDASEFSNSSAPIVLTVPTAESVINENVTNESAITENTLQPSLQPEMMESITVIIPARGNKEYKLHLTKGAAFEYQWKTDKGALFFDFHGEPKGNTTGYFKSFKKGTNTVDAGELTTIFEGSHGWYWKNNTAYPVVITLLVKGEYQRMDVAFEFDKMVPVITSNKTTHDTID